MKIAISLFGLLLAGCAMGGGRAYVSESPNVDRSIPPIAKRAGIYISPETEQYVENCGGLNVAVGPEIVKGMEKHCGATFKSVKRLGNPAPTADESKDLDLVISIDGCKLEWPRVGGSEWAPHFSVTFVVAGVDGKEQGRYAKEASARIVMASMSQKENERVGWEGFDLVLQATIQDFLIQLGK